jgi:murein DD-endopeptidase MepM/ murein hydrolase activator NlpD
MKILTTFLLIMLCATLSVAQTTAEKIQKMADLIMTAYNAKDYAAISRQFNAQMKASINDERLKGFLDGTHDEHGKLVKLGAPKFPGSSVGMYPAEFEKAKLELLVAVDAEGKISGMRISAPTPEKPRNTARNKTALGLPFKGEWLIFWGGDTPAQNYHQDAPTQRFAFDIFKTDAEGSSHKGEGKTNEDYYAFGQEIVADADGVVTDVVTGIKDNVPGVMNPLMAVGNFVMIRHANGEVSFFAHLKYESTKVKVGDQIKRGQVIGLCGNSGNSSEAHLHYQIQNTTLFEAENSMKVFFEKVLVKRAGKTETKTEYSPVKGDIVSQN